MTEPDSSGKKKASEQLETADASRDKKREKKKKRDKSAESAEYMRSDS